MDKISVIISGPASYGCAAAAIRSIFNSTYRNIEVILLNSGSLTDLRDIGEEFENRVIHMKSDSPSRAGLWNRGAERASGEMFSFFEGKDVSGKMRLELSVKRILDNPKTGLVFCGTTYINTEDGFLQGVNLLKEFAPEQALGRLFEGNFIASLSTTLVTREAFEKAGRFDEGLDYNGDYDLYLRIAERFRIEYINLPLLRYRVVPGPGSVSEEEWSGIDRRILNKHDVASIADSLTRLHAREDGFRVSLGRILARMGRFDESLRNFRKALEVNERNAEAYFLIGNYYYRQGDFEQAHHWYTECLRRDPDHAGSRNNLGVLHYVSGAWDESREEFNRAKNISANYYDPVFNLQCLQEKLAAERFRITGVKSKNAAMAVHGQFGPAQSPTWMPAKRYRT